MCEVGRFQLPTQILVQSPLDEETFTSDRSLVNSFTLSASFASKLSIILSAPNFITIILSIIFLISRPVSRHRYQLFNQLPISSRILLVCIDSYEPGILNFRCIRFLSLYHSFRKSNPVCNIVISAPPHSANCSLQ